MATYYVSPTGNDGAAGGLATPWLTLQRATQSPVAPGDLILVMDGNYSEPGSNSGIVCYLSPASRSSIPGTAANKITMRSLNQYGAKIIIPGSQTGSNLGFQVSIDHWNIEGFDISGGSGQSGTGVSYAGISVSFGSSRTGIGIRNNKIHHVGRTVCSNSPFGFSGILLGQPGGGAIDCIIEDNFIYSVGRLQQGESGCATTITQHDHGIYMDETTNAIVRRNVLYDNTRGYNIHMYPGVHTNFNIYNNTLVDTTDAAAGHFILSGTLTGGNIRNNISYTAKVAMVTYLNPVATNVSIDHNIYYNQESNGAAPAGITFSNNLLSTTPGFTNAATRDYTLLAGAFAIDKGVNVGQPFSGLAPDCGYNEYAASGDIIPPAVPTGLQVT